MAEPKPRRLSDLEVTPGRVSLRVDGQPMEAVRVQMGANYVWRIRFADQRLSEQVFANADRAVRWMASGMPVAAAEEAPPPEERVARRLERPTGRKGFEPQPDEPDPEWLPLDWVPRLRAQTVPPDATWEKIEWEPKRGKLTASAIAAVPGAPTLLPPTAFFNGRPVAPSADPPAPETAANAAGPPRRPG